jgi:hypothetical protein
MLDSPARVWERMGEVLLSTPEPCRPFIEALRSRCHSARYSGAGWVVPAREAEPAVALLRRYFPVVQDSRAGASPALRGWAGRRSLRQAGSRAAPGAARPGAACHPP